MAGEIEVQKIKVGEIKLLPPQPVCWLDWATRSLQENSSSHTLLAADVDPQKELMERSFKTVISTESALSCLRPLLFDKTSNGEDDLGAGDRQISIHQSTESKMVSTLLPSSNLTQIPPSVNASQHDWQPTLLTAFTYNLVNPICEIDIIIIPILQMWKPRHRVIK